MRDVMALFAGGLKWVLWWVGRVKGEMDESLDASIRDPRSEILTFFIPVSLFLQCGNPALFLFLLFLV